MPNTETFGIFATTQIALYCIKKFQWDDTDTTVLYAKRCKSLIELIYVHVNRFSYELFTSIFSFLANADTSIFRRRMPS